jgi:hypothetical protein
MNKTLEQLQREDEEALKAREAKPHDYSSGFTATLLAEAIADAKAVRATALANAKAAMDEAFMNSSEEYADPEPIDKQLSNIFTHDDWKP